MTGIIAQLMIQDSDRNGDLLDSRDRKMKVHDIADDEAACLCVDVEMLIGAGETRSIFERMHFY